jgi:hypothetical protein
VAAAERRPFVLAWHDLGDVVRERQPDGLFDGNDLEHEKIYIFLF